jgi:hypothetical protein
MLENSSEKFRVVAFLNMAKVGILTYIVFCYLKKKNSKFSEIVKGNLESKKRM